MTQAYDEGRRDEREEANLRVAHRQRHANRIRLIVVGAVVAIAVSLFFSITVVYALGGYNTIPPDLQIPIGLGVVVVIAILMTLGTFEAGMYAQRIQ